eukprot:Gb_06100 [translate_table: standard]
MMLRNKEKPATVLTLDISKLHNINWVPHSTATKIGYSVRASGSSRVFFWIFSPVSAESLLSSRAMKGEVRNLEAAILGFLKYLDATIDNAKHVNQVISALHSLASMLFDVHMDCPPVHGTGVS